MAFSLDEWKTKTAQVVRERLPLLKQAGADGLYFILASFAFLPAVQAAGQGDATVWSTVAATLGNVGAGLLANLLQHGKDWVDADVARELLNRAQTDEQARQTLDTLLKELGVVTVTQQALSEADRAWFVEALRAELRRLGSMLQIDTGGGAYVGAVTQAEHSLFVGRDQWNIYVNAIGRGQLSEEEFDKVRRAYLEWVHNVYNKARLWGLESLNASGDKPVRSLADVFVPLSLCRFTPPSLDEVREVAGRRADLLEQRRAYMRLVQERQEQGDEIELRSLLTRKDRLAVIGGPGCGKSTLLAYLAYALAEAGLSGAPLPFELPEGRKSLLPVLVALRGYAAYKQTCQHAPETRARNPHAGTLIGFILYELQRVSGKSLPEDFLERLLQGGGCLVMLDGLDEIVSQAERGQMRQQIDHLVDGYSKNCFLVTAREAGYQKDAMFGDNFLRLDVKPLSPEAIAALVGKWCRLLYLEAVEDNQQDILRAIEEMNRRQQAKGLSALVSTPLMVTMVVAVKWGKTELPRERARLYEAAVDVILQIQYTSNDEARKEVVDWGGPSSEQLEWLMELAYRMHSGGKAGAAVSEEAVRRILREGGVPAEKVQRFVEAVRNRGGLFEERAELFQFLHLSFQEYLAARWIVKQRDAALAALEGCLTDSWWREVLLLTYGFALMDHRPFAKTYLAWLSKPRDDAEQHLSGLELTGTALLEIEAADATDKQACARQIVTVLQDPACRVSRELRVQAGNTLGELGDVRFREDAWGLPDEPLLGFVRIPAGTFWMGSDLTRDPLASEDETPQHEVYLDAYYAGRYLVTVGQWRAFVKESGYRPSDERSLEGIANWPVRSVSLFDAQAYCQWLTDKLRDWAETPAELRACLQGGGRVALPSEAQWERAVRGASDRRIYPWGDEFNRDELDVRSAGPYSAVGCFAGGRSPEGLLDMIGSVWQWTRSRYWPYPYDCGDGREDEPIDDSERYVLRGGMWSIGWQDDRKRSRCSFRNSHVPSPFILNAGFRLFLALSS